MFAPGQFGKAKNMVDAMNARRDDLQELLLIRGEYELLLDSTSSPDRRTKAFAMILELSACVEWLEQEIGRS